MHERMGHPNCLKRKLCRRVLLAVKFDDQLLIDRQVDVFALRQSGDLARQIIAGDFNPVDARLARNEVLRGREKNEFLRSLTDGDLVANLALEGRNIHLATVDLDVSVTNHLARLAARKREPEAIADVVETGLKLLEQEFAGDAGLVGGLLVIGAELGLEGEVDALGLLLFAELQTVADDLLHFAGLAVLAWGEVALLDGAFLGEALGSLEEELCSVAAAEAADGSGVTCHFYYS